MRVTVKLGAPLWQVVGESKVVLSLSEGATVADALDELRNRYADFEAGLRGKGLRARLPHIPYSLFLNARPVAWNQAEATPLRDADRLYLFLPVAGG
jgi:molybdopterin converting factor small subunit